VIVESGNVDNEYRLWCARRDLKSPDRDRRARALRLIDHLANEETRQCWVPGLGRSPGRAGIASNNPKSLAPSTSLLAWYWSERGITQSGGVVDQWDDLSGNSRHLTATSTARPAYEATGFVGRPSVLFNGTTNVLKNVSGAATAIFGGNDQPFACYLVFEALALSPYVGFVNCSSSTDGSTYMLLWSSATNLTTLRQGGDAQTLVTGSALSANTKYVVRWFYSGTATTTQVNSGSVSGPGAQNNVALVADVFSLGGWVSNVGTQNYANMRISNLFFYAVQPTAAEDARIAAYLFNLYGIANG